MNEDEKLHNELEENYEKIVEMLSNGNFLQLNDKAISLTELNEYINAQQEEIHRLNNIISNMEGELMTMYLDIMEYNEDYAKKEIKKLKGVDKE